MTQRQRDTPPNRAESTRPPLARRAAVIGGVPLIAGISAIFGAVADAQPDLLSNPLVVCGAAAYLSLKALDELVSSLVGSSAFDRAWDDITTILRVFMGVAAIGYVIGQQLAKDNETGLWSLVLAMFALGTLAGLLAWFRSRKEEQAAAATDSGQSSEKLVNASSAT